MQKIISIFFLILVIVKQIPLHATEDPRSFFENFKLVSILIRILFFSLWTDFTFPVLKIIPLNKSQFIEEGQHILECENLPSKITTPVSYLGHVSSSYHSPNLNQSIGLAMIAGGNNLLGQK